MVITTTTGNSFNVFPKKWKDISDNDIKRMFKAYTDFLIFNEEKMTFEEAEKAWDIAKKWKAHLSRRDIEINEYDWIG